MYKYNDKGSKLLSVADDCNNDDDIMAPCIWSCRMAQNSSFYFEVLPSQFLTCS